MKKTIVLAFIAITLFLSFTVHSNNLAEDEGPRPTNIEKLFI